MAAPLFFFASTPKEQILSVLCNGEPVGELVITANNRLKSGARSLPKTVVLMILYQFTRQDMEFGSFRYGNRKWQFEHTGFEESLRLTKGRQAAI